MAIIQDMCVNINFVALAIICIFVCDEKNNLINFSLTTNTINKLKIYISNA